MEGGSNHIKYNAITARTNQDGHREDRDDREAILTGYSDSPEILTKTWDRDEGENQRPSHSLALNGSFISGGRNQFSPLSKRRKKLSNSVVNVETNCEQLESSELPMNSSKLTSVRRQNKVTSGWI